jgi:hypothetical protein
MSNSLNGSASRLTDQYFGSVRVLFLPRPQRSTWRRPLSLSHAGQPMKQPCEYQNAACPLLHASPVMFAHLCVFTPTWYSTEFRVRG